MPDNIGGQKITLLYRTVANSAEVNRRFMDIRQLGIYKGGYLQVVNASTAKLSKLVCEISNGIHQVRGEITDAFVENLTMVKTNREYVVLRWEYLGDTSDYMEIETVKNPLPNDLIVGKGIFDGSGNLTEFTYEERSTPNTQDLFLKVEAPDSTMVNKMKVSVRAGRIQTNAGMEQINDQLTPSAFTHSGGGLTEYGLVYVTSSGVIQIVNASGNTSIPLYNGKLVLAVVALKSTDTVITQDMILDVRNWITAPTIPDGETIERSSNGKLQIKSGGLGQSTQVVGTSNITKSGAWADMANMSITITTKGGNVLLMFSGTIRISAEGGGGITPLYFRFNLDGTPYHIQHSKFSYDQTNDTFVLSMQYLFTGLNAELHNFKMQWQTTSGTIAQDGASYPRILSAVELSN